MTSICYGQEPEKKGKTLLLLFLLDFNSLIMTLFMGFMYSLVNSLNLYNLISQKTLCSGGVGKSILYLPVSKNIHTIITKILHYK